MFFKFLFSFLLSGLLSVAQAAQVTQVVQDIKGRIQIHVQPTMSALDILFVIDDSGSMHDHQKNLRSNIPLFVQNILDQGVHLKVGVTTTSDCYKGNPSKSCDGNFEAGVLDSKNANFLEHLNQSLDVGVSGSATETPLEMARKALSQNRHADFLRPEAHLAIIFLTDEDDIASPGSLDEYIRFFSSVKKSPSQMQVASIQTDLTPSCRSVSPSKGNLQYVVESLKGKLISICSQNYGELLSDLGLSLGNIINTEIPLFVEPDLASLVATYGSYTLPRGDLYQGWIYDSQKNSLLLGSKINWSALGTHELIISFTPRQWK